MLATKRQETFRPSVPETLSHSQIAEFREQGFLALNAFLTPTELRDWREAATRAVARRLTALDAGLAARELRLPLTSRLRAASASLLGEAPAARLSQAARKLLSPRLLPAGMASVLDTNQGDKTSFYANVYTQALHLSRDHDGLRALVRDARLARFAAQLAGVPAMRLYHDQALFKMPGNHFTAWHLDAPYWSFHATSAVTIWIALDDATPENGCLQYLPGTHRTARMDRNVSIGNDFDGLLDLYPEWRRLTPVSCPCPAGSVLFHHGLVAHAAGPNRTDAPRRAYSIALMPDGAVFNGIRDVLPDGYFRSLRVGDRLDDEELHPLLA